MWDGLGALGCCHVVLVKGYGVHTSACMPVRGLVQMFRTMIIRCCQVYCCSLPESLLAAADMMLDLVSTHNLLPCTQSAC
jgi:hypothetical protein